ncbi:MAG: tRNA pseudouridine(38-40) synthase TruA [bacterium]|nr:tRNA pseudouridine(38-40) synthase TruA [bacterium]
MTSHRYKLTIEYDGTPFVGWQKQDNGASVQSSIGTAFKGFCGTDNLPYGAGRTDAGVHATGQIAHIDMAKSYPTDTIRDAVNQHLRPIPISILKVETVSAEFDARFSARMRHYQYKIVNRRPPLTVQEKRVWLVHRPLDVDKMNKAASLLHGKHDFTAFRSTNCQAKSPVKTLSRLEVTRSGEELTITASARSFMHNQVRSMVGSLQMVGDGRWPVQQIRDVLDSKDRTACGPVAPAHGLYFTRVDYDPA